MTGSHCGAVFRYRAVVVQAGELDYYWRKAESAGGRKNWRSRFRHGKPPRRIYAP
jgi:hypothetical protein